MPNSNNAYSYNSWLNFIPVGEDGSMVELRPVINGDDTRWCWSARLGISVRRCLSEKSFATREDAFEDASEWWEKYCTTLRDRTPINKGRSHSLDRPLFNQWPEYQETTGAAGTTGVASTTGGTTGATSAAGATTGVSSTTGGTTGATSTGGAAGGS